MWRDLLLAFCGALGALVAHELGHLFAGRAVGINALTVKIGVGPVVAEFRDSRGTWWAFKLFPLGASCAFFDGGKSEARGTKKLAKSPLSIRTAPIMNRVALLLAGPVTNALLALALFAAAYLQDPHFAFGSLAKGNAGLCFLIGALSAAIALLNLLPVPPLDGGRLLLLALEAFTGRAIPIESEKRLFALGKALLSIGTVAAILFAGVSFLRTG